MIEPKWLRVEDLTDVELHRLKVDMQVFATYTGKIASRSKNRATAIQSELDKRAAKQRSRPRPTEKPTISDHAIVRYLQRVKGMDIAAIEQEMWANINQSEPILSENILSHNGFVYVRRPASNFIVTVLLEDELNDEDIAFSEQMAQEK